MIAAGLLFGIVLFAVYASGAPELDEELLRDPISPVFLANDEETEIPFFTAQNREYVNYEDIPSVLEDAILATEDNRFYDHSGIDVIRLGGAVIANITGGFGSQGASTITQQVIKNSFLSNEKTLKRKAQEAYLAYKLEREYDKEEIFEMYFNKILMSGNTYGFGTAAEEFFGKPAGELELHEAALLAGMPQSPNRFNPFKNPEAAEERRDIVLNLMEQHGKIDAAQKEEAWNTPVESTLLPEDQRRPAEQNTEYIAFMEMVVDELETLDGDYSLDEGLTIYTTLEPYVQERVNETMASDLFFDEEVESAMTVVDTKTGAISAVGAARKYEGDVRRNFATSTDRVIGSTIKPLVSYGPAIEHLGWSTGQTLVDEEYSYSSGQEIRNVDGQFLGPMTLREALYRSRNIPAVKALGEVGSDNAADFTQKLGLDFGGIYESAALGTPEKQISTVDMAGAFAAFGNNGVFTEPHTIKKIVFRDGTTEAVVSPEPVNAMKDSTAYMVTDMLRDAVDLSVDGATGKEAAINGLDMAGKTGTSNYAEDDLRKYGLDASSARDVWFAGYTTDYSISVWSGYPSVSTPIDTASNERLLAQRLFKQVMSQISSPETASFQQPDSVTEEVIEVGTEPLRLASPFTPWSMRSEELFARGSEPSTVSERFVADPDRPSGLRADVSGNTANLSWSYGDADGISFEVSVNGEVLTTTSDTNYSYNGLEQGVPYTFRVVAIQNGRRSEPASTTIEIAPPEEEEPEEEPVEEEPVEEEPVEEEPVEEEPVEEEPAEEPTEEEPTEEEPVETPDEPVDTPEQPEEPDSEDDAAADEEESSSSSSSSSNNGNGGNGNNGNGNSNGDNDDAEDNSGNESNREEEDAAE
nr:penicillin-binding protein 1A [Planococcus sp. ISL-109]